MTKRNILLPSRWFLVFLIIVLFIALFRDFIAGDRPIVQYSTESGIEFPLFSGMEKQRDEKSYLWQVKPIIPYNPEKLSDADLILLPPLSVGAGKSTTRYYHWMGTDGMGRDVLAGIIYGCRIALLIGIISGLVSLFFGYSLGAVAGYFGDTDFKMNALAFFGIVIIGVLYLYHIYWVAVRGERFPLITTGIVVLLLIGFIIFGKSYKKFNISIPVDTLIMRTIDLSSSIPALLLLLVISVLLRGWNVLEIAILIGFLRWPTLSRHVRAEIRALKNSEEVEYTKGLGFSDYFILTRRIFMRSIQSALVVLAFVTGSSIVLEATLSFLGLGLPAHTISWGNLIHQSRAYPEAWWLVVFPGIMLFSIVLGLNQWGRKVNKAVFQSTR